MSEINEQAKVFKYFWNNYPKTRTFLFHVPNGGKRTKIEAAQLKASGVVAGIPDLLFIWKGVFYAIEMKDVNGYLSTAQKELHTVWIAAGISVKTFWNSDDAINHIENIILTA